MPPKENSVPSCATGPCHGGEVIETYYELHTAYGGKVNLDLQGGERYTGGTAKPYSTITALLTDVSEKSVTFGRECRVGPSLSKSFIIRKVEVVSTACTRTVVSDL